MTAYKLQPEAEKDLEDIWLYTAHKWGVEQAMQYVDAFDEAFKFWLTIRLLHASEPNLRQPYEYTLFKNTESFI
ncbi:MAG: type II toxin-antitoxin system RelE/ParE family toxin [Psychrosphaera sp.]|nr:type II toxin-antitoxin system RelE/ParE family toxin [Psychrosphaera sp.]